INLWSCALFPNMTRDFRESRILGYEPYLQENDVDLNISTSTQVTTFISTCLAAWCENSETCGKSVCKADETTVSNRTLLSAGGVDPCLDSICGVAKYSSPDIAGVGVITSIFIQITMAMAAPIALVCCRIASGPMSRRFEDRNEKDFDKLEYLRANLLGINGLQESLLITLDEFQRAQCCFAIAIDVASLMTLYTGGQPVTHIDRNAIALASFTGTLPNVVVLATLLLYRVRDLTYVVYLTSFTWTLSVVTGYLPLIRNPGDVKYNYI
ncbi:hypothetical protein EK21DRAFT_28472, partial [Setomelanomma holmii]